MSRSSLNDMLGSIVDPALPWNFDLVIDRLPTGVSGNVRDITIRCQTTSMPGVQFSPVEVEAHGVKLKYRGRKQYQNTIECQFIENVDWSTYQLFKEWANLQLNWTNNTGSSSAIYKTTGTIITYDDAGNVTKEQAIKGLWIEQIQDIQLDGSQDGYVQPNVTFSYDYLDGE